jgi:hypothetical protein
VCAGYPWHDGNRGSFLYMVAAQLNLDVSCVIVGQSWPVNDRHYAAVLQAFVERRA